MDLNETHMQPSIAKFMLVGILVAVAASVVIHLLTTVRRRHADVDGISTTNDSHSRQTPLSSRLAAGAFAGLLVLGTIALIILQDVPTQPQHASQTRDAFESSHSRSVGLVSQRAAEEDRSIPPAATPVPAKVAPKPVAPKPVATKGEGANEESVTVKLAEPNDDADVPTPKKTDATEPKVALPKWITTSRVEDGDATLLVLSSRRYATVDRAKQEVLLAATNVVTEHFHKFEPAGARWSVPSDMVQTHAVRQEYIEKQNRDFGRFTAPMYRVHLQLRLSPRLHDKFREPWQSFVVERRLWGLGSVFALLTLLTATMTSYLRLDALTDGAYRRRLKLAAASLIAAGGLVVWEVLPNV